MKAFHFHLKECVLQNRQLFRQNPDIVSVHCFPSSFLLEVQAIVFSLCPAKSLSSETRVNSDIASVQMARLHRVTF
jgi:hypothetical protein